MQENRRDSKWNFMLVRHLALREKTLFQMSIAASFIYTSMIFATGYGSIMRDVRIFFQMMGAYDYLKELV